MKKRYRQILVIMLALVMVWNQNIPHVLANDDNSNVEQLEMESDFEQIPDSCEEDVIDILEINNEPEADIVKELVSEREEYSKRYLMSDGSESVILYSDPVHYESADGMLAEIDNSLIKTNKGYENVANSYHVLFTDNEKNCGEVQFKEENYEINWSLMDNSNCVRVDADYEEPSTLTAEVELPEMNVVDEDVMGHVIKQSTVTFDGYENDVSLEYTPVSDGVKENIILSSKDSGNTYTFKLKLKGLEAHLNSNNIIELYDEATKQLKYYFPAPYMTDADGKLSYDVWYSLSELPPESENTTTEEESQSETETTATEEESPSETETTTTEEESPSETETTTSEEESPSETENTTTEEEHPSETETLAETLIEKNTQKALTNLTATVEAEESTEAENAEETVETESAVEVETESNTEVETEAETENLTETESAPETEGITETETETESTTEAETESIIEVETENIAETENATETEEETENKAESVSGKDSEYIYLTITADNKWLETASLPVMIDPVVKKHKKEGLLDAGSIDSSNTLHETLFVGKRKGINYQSYIRFELPKMKKQSVISGAQLYLGGTKNEAGSYITIHRVDENWYAEPINQTPGAKPLDWNQLPQCEERPLDYAVAGGYFDITKAVREWQEGTRPNYGLKLVKYKENHAREKIVLRNSATKPYLKITYRNATGLENYWGTHVTGAGTAGLGYINNYTGALTVVNTDVATAGNRMPMSIGHVYNSNADLEENYAGNRWRLNYRQTIQVPADEVDITKYPYVYTDADGTPHYFKAADVTYLLNGAEKKALKSATLPSAEDEDGLKLYIVPVTNNTLKKDYPLKLIDKSASVVRYFDKMGRLAMITDSNQYENAKNSDKKEKNSITITYQDATAKKETQGYATAIADVQALYDYSTQNSKITDDEIPKNYIDKAINSIEELKTDIYTQADYVTAKKINAAWKAIDYLAHNKLTLRVIKTKSKNALDCLQNAKERADALVELSGQRISCVTDAIGNKAEFTYDAEHRIKTISDPSFGGQTNTYYYDDEGNLVKIDFPMGKTAHYTYDDEGYLTSLADESGYQVSYTYDNAQHRICKVTESAKNESGDMVQGQTYSIEYHADNTNVFRFSGMDDQYGNEDDVLNTYVFDEQGRTINVYSSKVDNPKVIGANAYTYD